MTIRARKQPASQRRRTILDGARNVFAESGYAGADTAKLAAAAGVKPAALYRYFPGKRDLYVTVLDEAGERLREIWRGAFAGEGEVLETIREIGIAYYEHSGARSDVMRLWFRSLNETSDERVREVLAGSLLQAVGLFEAKLEDGRREGSLRPDVNPRIAAWHFMAIGLMFDLLDYLGLGDELDHERVEEWGNQYIRGLEGESRPAGPEAGVYR